MGICLWIHQCTGREQPCSHVNIQLALCLPAHVLGNDVLAYMSEGTAATCCSRLCARYLWSSISVTAEQHVLLIFQFLGQCLNLPLGFLGAQQYSQAWRGYGSILQVEAELVHAGGGPGCPSDHLSEPQEDVLCTLAEWFCRSQSGL